VKVRRKEFFDEHVVGRSDADELNKVLAAYRKRMLEAATSLIEAGEPLSGQAVRKRMDALAKVVAVSLENDMIDWMSSQVEMLRHKQGTIKHYTTLINRLREFGRMTRWDDLSVENICLFDDWLHNITCKQSDAAIKSGKKPSRISDGGVYNYHKCLKAILNRAKTFKRIAINPYDDLRGKFKRGDKESVEYLTEGEMQAIESCHPLKGSMMASARDLFVFQMYTGLSYSDAQSFDIRDYKKVDGKWVNVGERIKTGVSYVSVLLPQAVEVLERYGMQVPKINNIQYNASLKVIQQALGIRTKLHSHLARHTFATRALRLGAKIENVSRMLGHTNITQTQRYAKVLAQSVHDDFELINEKLNNYEK
jgi:integrase